tara:strand:- start:468 stop:686 length:219 start_codon:yes stop_codon:yes gene_type:complete
VIYIVRVGGVGNSNICFCSPCHDCFNKFKALGIKKIVYVNKDGNLECGKVSEMKINHVSLGNRILGKKAEID